MIRCQAENCRQRVQVSKEEYVKVSSEALGQQLAEKLRSQGLNPYVVPVGGSNPLGTWGYLEFMNELNEQAAHAGKFTDIVMVQ